MRLSLKESGLWSEWCLAGLQEFMPLCVWDCMSLCNACAIKTQTANKLKKRRHTLLHRTISQYDNTWDLRIRISFQLSFGPQVCWWPCWPAIFGRGDLSLRRLNGTVQCGAGFSPDSDQWSGMIRCSTQWYSKNIKWPSYAKLINDIDRGSDKIFGAWEPFTFDSLRPLNSYVGCVDKVIQGCCLERWETAPCEVSNREQVNAFVAPSNSDKVWIQRV